MIVAEEICRFLGLRGRVGSPRTDRRSRLSRRILIGVETRCITTFIL